MRQDGGATAPRAGRGHPGWPMAAHQLVSAYVNFLLTSFLVSALLQSFWLRNLKPTLRAGLTLIGLARELDRGLVGCRAPWWKLVARAP